MSVQTAFEALKRKDFSAARDAVTREDVATFGTHHFLIKGLSELSLKEWEPALATFAAATERFPDYALFWLNRGIAEENLKMFDAAIISQERCIALNPDQGEASGNLSNLYRKKLRFTEAEAMARRSLACGADKGDALNCLGLALGKLLKFDEAREAFAEAHKAAPDNANFLANRANLETEVFNFEAAWKFFAAARTIKDEAVFRHDEGLARLLAGDLKRGRLLFEARLEMPNALRLLPSCPRWKGESLAGKKLLILAEQGFGDVIQFCRYQRYLTEGELVWAVPKNLVRLLSPSLRGMVKSEQSPLPACDYYVPVISLALLSNVIPAKAGIQIENSFSPDQHNEVSSHHNLKELLSNKLPDTDSNLDTGFRRYDDSSGEGIYLSAPTTPLLPQGPRKRKIGLVWAGSRTHQRDHERSIPLKLFAPLVNSIEADFYAPFMGEALEEIGDLPITRLDDLVTDFADTAALLKQMDCLITVDTSVAHLAGALGVKTFLLVSHCPDWRWGLTGETTPLYPSVTILRQPTYGDWQGAIDKLEDLLRPDSLHDAIEQ